MIARTDFEGLPLGPVAGGVLTLASPPGTGAMLIGLMEVIATPATAPANAGWGGKVLHPNGPVQLVMGGPIKRVGFSSGSRGRGQPDPKLSLVVLGSNFSLLPKVTISPELNGAPLPAFGGEFTAQLAGGYAGGVYGTGTIEGDIIGSIVLGDD